MIRASALWVKPTSTLSILDSVGSDGVVITKHGRPVAKLIPIGVESGSFIGALTGRLVITGDIFSASSRS